MRPRFPYLLFLIAALLFPAVFRAQTTSKPKTAATGPAPAPRAVIEGTVFDPSSRPVAQARVGLLFAIAPFGETRTDAQGHYRFAGLAGGTYEVIANLPGFTKLSAKVELQPGVVHQEDLHLELSAVEQEVVVSASLGGALAPQLGSSVSLIGRQEIEDRGAQNVYDVLRGVPGMEINQTGRRGAVTSAFIRGGNSNYNLVMLDGIPLDDFGGGFNLAPVQVDGVERIEVTRGPQSALYGSNALAGVINVVTLRGESAPHFSFLAEGGSYDTRRFASSGAGRIRGFHWSYGLSRLATEGAVQNDNYWNQSATLSLGYSRGPRRDFAIRFYGDANDAGEPGPYGSDPDHLFPGLDTVSRAHQNLFGYQASYAEQFTTRFRQVTTVSVAADRFGFHSSFGDSFTNNLRVAANTRSEIVVAEKDSLIAGFEYDHEQFESTFVANASNMPFTLPRANYAFFAENRWNPGNRWFFNTGVRVDTIRTAAIPPDAFGSRPLLPASAVVQVNPRVSIAYLAREAQTPRAMGGTRIHGSFGTGIRPPDGFELGFTDNPALKPERSISFDAGVEQRFARDRIVFDTTFFYNRFQDQIVTLGGSFPNLSTFTSANLANARAYGIETTLRLRPIRSLDVSAEYLWLNTAILELDGATGVQFPFTVGQPLIRRPHSSAGFNATWVHRRLMLNLNGSIRGAVLDLEPNFGNFACVLGMPCLFRNPGYVLLNSGFAYQFPGGFEIYGRLNNFLNAKYEESLGFPALRLNFMAGVKFYIPAKNARPGSP